MLIPLASDYELKVDFTNCSHCCSETSSGPDLTRPPNPSEVFGIKKSSSGSGISESDISGLVSQLRELQKRNVELDEENKKLISELHSNEVEKDMLLLVVELPNK
ncbi:hypothetical protein L2E82_11368 [Cichorium intybus]|uniref:Uncharacterized protein n=1 Tax=Cichorium intybus TaxID=13427 RepID=A0ACB9GE78_CICIN|nr:hypothetical protein L2E82_11368 [Cichorium intybus]